MAYHRSWYSVRITIERPGDEPIFNAKNPLPGVPTVVAESSPDTN
jgi:hypothetical protein